MPPNTPDFLFVSFLLCVVPLFFLLPFIVNGNHLKCYSTNKRRQTEKIYGKSTMFGWGMNRCPPLKMRYGTRTRKSKCESGSCRNTRNYTKITLSISWTCNPITTIGTEITNAIPHSMCFTRFTFFSFFLFFLLCQEISFCSSQIYGQYLAFSSLNCRSILLGSILTANMYHTRLNP